MTPEIFTRQLTQEGYEVEHKSLPAGKQVAAHTHPFEVKALVTAGQVTLGVDGKLTVYRAGDIFTMAQGCEHTERYGDDGVSYVVGRKYH